MSSSLSYDGFFEGCDYSGTSATSLTDGWASAWDEPRLAAGGSSSIATDEITEPDSAISEDGARTSEHLAGKGNLKDVDDDNRRHFGASEKTALHSASQKRCLSGALTPDAAEEDNGKNSRISKERTSETRPLSHKKVKKIIAKPAVWNDPFESSDSKMRRDYIAYCTTCELWLGDESNPKIRRKYNEHRRTPLHIRKYKDVMSWDYTTPLGRSGCR
ncbi:hypothetical protein DFP72DRAFT_857352 [Ephemerocybe angulata]|uniref:Uncharacterized protein n=1 Tax=Ephemerocybe angulata TaxID=980116 RepID=A0A8H6LWB6_9AGAR|nr:hypothetical protein DFP72DRAFT_857352 [Tulosesus angulatus]